MPIQTLTLLQTLLEISDTCNKYVKPKEDWNDSNERNLFYSINTMNSVTNGVGAEVGDQGMVPGGRDSVSSDMFEFGCNIDSALPSDSDLGYDHHSSEEELEVINNKSYDEDDEELILASQESGSLVEVEEAEDVEEEEEEEEASSMVLRSHHHHFQNHNRLKHRHQSSPCLSRSSSASSENCKRKWSQLASNRLSVESTCSSDEEVQELLGTFSATPVEFCTSPPVDAHKPSRSQSPPPKLFLFSADSSPEGSSGGGELNLEICNNPQEGGKTGPSPVIVSSLSSAAPAALLNGSGGVFRGLPRNNEISQHNIQNNPYPIMSNFVSSTTPSSFNKCESGNRGNIPSSSFILNTKFSHSKCESVLEGAGLGSAKTLLNSEPLSSNNNHYFNNQQLPPASTFTSGAGGNLSILNSALEGNTPTFSSGGHGSLVSSTSSPTLNLASSSSINYPSSNVSSSFGGNNSMLLGSASSAVCERRRNSSGRELSRRRHRHHHNPRFIQRPWLDFEKMQQVQGTGSRYEGTRLLREIRQLTSLPIS